MSPNRRLLIPTTTYRGEDFVGAAGKLDVDLVLLSDRRFTGPRPLDAVVAVDVSPLVLSASRGVIASPDLSALADGTGGILVGRPHE